MKILVAVTDLDLGGVTTALINFCNEMILRGHQIDLVNMGKDNPTADERIDQRINRIKIDGIAKYWKLGADDLRKSPGIEKIKLSLLAVVKKLKNNKGTWNNYIFRDYCVDSEYDVAVAFRQCAPCYHFVLNCVNAKRKIGFIHGELEFMGDISSWDCYFEKLDRIACVSNAVRDGFAKKYVQQKDKFVTIYNMIDIKKIKTLSNEECVIKMNDNDFNLLTVSRIENESKRIDRIPNTCKLLLKNGVTNFHWYIVGDGENLVENKELTKKLGVEDYITFCGAIKNPYPVYKEADCFVLTSKWESFGIVVLEALINKIPVVATNYPALKELLEDKKYGYIVEQNVEELADKLAIIIQDKEEYNRIKQNLESFEISNDTAYYQFIDLFY